jgi:hypothetical protein
MMQIRKLPYLIPSSKYIDVGIWQTYSDGHLIPLDTSMPNWDPAITLQASINVDVNGFGILEDCGFSSDAELSIAAVWSSEGTMLRGVGSKKIITYEPFASEYNLRVEIEGLKLAKWVDLSVQLVLVTPSIEKKPFAAKYAGSILFKSTPLRVYLQGEGARFPIEVIDFGNTQYPNDAGWALFWDPFNLHQTALGDLRLYINARHNRVKSAVSESRPEDYDLRESIRFDIARLLIQGALNNDDFVENPDQYGSDSIGAVIRNMIRNYFPQIDLADLRDEIHNSQTFDPKLQDKLRLFQSKE